MKRLVIFIFPLIMLINEVKSQDVELGLKAGMNVATLGRSELGMQSRIGYHIGGTAEFILTPFFSLQTELMYSLQGAAIDRTQNIFLNYHYLNLPVFAKAYFYEDASFEIGAQYGYLMKSVNESFLGPQGSAVNNNDFSIVFGLAYKLNDKVNFGIRYNLGLSNTANRDIIYEQRFTNRVLQLSLGVIF